MRPEKVWLSDLTPEMVQTDGILKATVYDGATTQYLVSIAPDLSLTVWSRTSRGCGPRTGGSAGDRVDIGWLPEHVSHR